MILRKFLAICLCFVQDRSPCAGPDKDNKSENLAVVLDFERDGMAVLRWRLGPAVLRMEVPGDYGADGCGK